MSDDPAGPAYRPIDCDVHDQLLALATLRRDCVVVHRDPEGVESVARGRIIDVYSLDGAEWLRLEGGEPIRLDRLVRVNDVPLPAAPD